MARKIITKIGTGKTLFTNDTLSQEFQKNDCEKRHVGSKSTYYVVKGTHIASTKEEANRLAQEDIEANGQAFANTNGTCTPLDEPQVLKAETFNTVTETVTPYNLTIINKVPKKIENKEFLLIVDILVGTKYIAEGLVINAAEPKLVLPYTNPDGKSVRIDIQKLIYDDELVGEYALTKVTPLDEVGKLEQHFSTNPQTCYWSENPGDIQLEFAYNAHKQPTVEFLAGWRDCDGVKLQIKSSTYVVDFVKDYPLGFITKQWGGKGVVLTPDLREIGNKMKDVEIRLIPASNTFINFDFTKLTSNVGEAKQDGNDAVITISQLDLDTDVKIEFNVVGV